MRAGFDGQELARFAFEEFHRLHPFLQTLVRSQDSRLELPTRAEREKSIEVTSPRAIFVSNSNPTPCGCYDNGDRVVGPRALNDFCAGLFERVDDGEYGVTLNADRKPLTARISATYAAAQSVHILPRITLALCGAASARFFASVASLMISADGARKSHPGIALCRVMSIASALSAIQSPTRRVRTCRLICVCPCVV